MGSTNTTLLSSLSKLQKRVLKIVLGYKHRVNFDVFKGSKLLTLQNIYKYKINLLMFKVNRNLVPEVVRDLFVCNSNIHYHRTRGHFQYHVQYARTETFARSIRIRGVNIWNRTIQFVDPGNSMFVFKKRVKNFFLSAQ